MVDISKQLNTLIQNGYEPTKAFNFLIGGNNNEHNESIPTYVQSEPAKQPAIPSQYEGITKGESKADLVQADLDPEDFKDITEEEVQEDEDAIIMVSIQKKEEKIEPDEIVVLTQSKVIEEEPKLDDEEEEAKKEKENAEEFKKEIKQLEIFDKVSLKDFKLSSQAINYNNTIHGL